MDTQPWAPIEVDITLPSVARVYDYHFGGSHDVESDRAFDPEHVPGQVVAAGGLDLRRPVAVLALLVLHFVPDARHAPQVVAHYLRRTAPGRHLAVGRSRSDGARAAVAGQKPYGRERSPDPVHPRTAAEVAALSGELTLLPPGVVAPPARRPDPGDPVEVPDDDPVLDGVARKD